MTDRIRISGVCERDIDLLLLEELIASSNFRSWLSDQAGLGRLDPLVAPKVYRSVTHSSGESDLEMYVTLADGTDAALLVENKVDAGLQTRQAERYTERADAYLTGAKCHRARTLLIAPRRYFGEQAEGLGFDATLSYEDLDAWFESSCDAGERVSYKRALIAAAIEKASTGYQSVADEAMTSLWRSYWELVQADAPELNMSEPTGRPSGSTFVFFRPDLFPKQLQLVHKFANGNVDLEFSGWGDRLAELRDAVGSRTPPDCSFVRAAKSVALRRRVPMVELSVAVDVQSKQMGVGINAARQLLAWFRQHEGYLRSVLREPV